MRPDLIQVTEWQWERFGDGDAVVHLCVDGTRELRIELESDDIEWLNRAMHPSYARQVDPILAHLAGKALSMEIVPDGPTRWGASVTYADGSGITSRAVPLTAALLLASRHPVPVFAASQLFDVLPL